MNTQELLAALWTTLTEHVKLPENLTWTPLAAMALLAALGLVLMVRGARWAPGMAGCAFLAAGGLAGSHFGAAYSLPIWPAITVGGGVGLVLGVVMFRFWQAVLLGACCSAASIGVYYVRDLTPAVQSWLGDGGQITLRPAGAVVGEAAHSSLAEWSSLWNHLVATVPNFQFNFVTLLASASLAGIAFGWLLPRASRTLWASTLGTAICGVGATAILQKFAPDILEKLLSSNTLSWAVVAGAWLVSLAINAHSMRGKPKERGDQPAEEPAAA